MANQSVNLKYASQGLGFFNNLGTIHTGIVQMKQKGSIANFTEVDEKEIGRGLSYALFPELKEHFNNGGVITIDLFKKLLSDRGVTYEAFQNKILSMVLQKKVGLQFRIGELINSLFLSNEFLLMVDHGYQLELVVNSSNNVSLHYKTSCYDYSSGEKVVGVLSVNTKVQITPELVTVSEFDVEQLIDTEESNKAVKFLEENQQNILQKLVTYIKRVFGYDSELRFEETKNDDNSWDIQGAASPAP